MSNDLVIEFVMLFCFYDPLGLSVSDYKMVQIIFYENARKNYVSWTLQLSYIFFACYLCSAITWIQIISGRWKKYGSYAK